MHADDLETDEALVHQLLAAQFPQWAELPIQALPAGGTDNAIYRRWLPYLNEKCSAWM